MKGTIRNLEITNNKFTSSQAKKVFKNTLTGDLTPLKKTMKNKQTRNLDDVEYCVVAAELFEEMDKMNSSITVPTNYGYPIEFVNLCREVKKGYDDGVSKSELFNYIGNCVEID